METARNNHYLLYDSRIMTVETVDCSGEPLFNGFRGPAHLDILICVRFALTAIKPGDRKAAVALRAIGLVSFPSRKSFQPVGVENKTGTIF